MGKYDPLKDYLIQEDADLVPLTFDEIEQILRAKLPARAKTNKDWWFFDLNHKIEERYGDHLENSGFHVFQVQLEEKPQTVFFARSSIQGGFVGTIEHATMEAFNKIGIRLTKMDREAIKYAENKFDLISRKEQLVVECALVTDAEFVLHNPDKILNQAFAVLDKAPKDYRKILSIKKHQEQDQFMSVAEALVNFLPGRSPERFELWEIDIEKQVGSKLWPIEEEPIRQLEEEQEDISHDETEREYNLIPASDRIVAIDHNSPELAMADAELDGVEEQLKEITSNEFNMKDALIEGLQFCKSMLRATRVFADQVYNFILEFLQRIERLANQITKTTIAVGKAIASVVILLKVIF